MSEHKDPHRTDGIKRTPLVAERLLLLQEIFEGAGRGASTRMAERMAELLGITLHRWSNVLRGSPLSIGLAQRIVLTVPGVSLDWLYFGRPQGLSCQTAEKLGCGAAHLQPSAGEQKPAKDKHDRPPPRLHSERVLDAHQTRRTGLRCRSRNQAGSDFGDIQSLFREASMALRSVAFEPPIPAANPRRP
jgi:hypothetical protein